MTRCLEPRFYLSSMRSRCCCFFLFYIIYCTYTTHASMLMPHWSLICSHIFLFCFCFFNSCEFLHLPSWESPPFSSKRNVKGMWTRVILSRGTWIVALIEDIDDCCRIASSPWTILVRGKSWKEEQKKRCWVTWKRCYRDARRWKICVFGSR